MTCATGCATRRVRQTGAREAEARALSARELSHWVRRQASSPRTPSPSSSSLLLHLFHAAAAFPFAAGGRCARCAASCCSSFLIRPSARRCSSPSSSPPRRACMHACTAWHGMAWHSARSRALTPTSWQPSPRTLAGAPAARRLPAAPRHPPRLSRRPRRRAARAAPEGPRSRRDGAPLRLDALARVEEWLRRPGGVAPHRVARPRRLEEPERA